MPDPRKQYDATIGDRKVPVFAATETQIAFLARFTRRADIAFKANKMEAAMQSIADILDLLDSLIVDPDDREYLTGRMMTGELEAEEFINAYANAIPESGETPTPPRVTRGRAK
jgi:hypothetical protein